MYDYISTFIIILLHALFFRDLLQIASNQLYTHYNSTSGIIISYIIACIYFNTKKIKSLNTAKPYIFLYDFISIATIITLSIAPILTEPTILNSQMLIPMFFIYLDWPYNYAICQTAESYLAVWGNRKTSLFLLQGV